MPKLNIKYTEFRLILSLMYVKKFAGFCQAIKKMHTKNWILFSASRSRLSQDIVLWIRRCVRRETDHPQTVRGWLVRRCLCRRTRPVRRPRYALSPPSASTPSTRRLPLHARLRYLVVNWNITPVCTDVSAISALTLLVGRQEGHPACKNWVVRCWHGYLYGARCRPAYGPADATATHCLLLQ